LGPFLFLNAICRAYNCIPNANVSPRPFGKTKLNRLEKEILGLFAEGLISKEIADKLFISVNTVNTHQQRILEKLDGGNSMEAIKYAAELGLFGK
jgi:DNA-binding CsgD family transcriptional regulator